MLSPDLIQGQKTKVQKVFQDLFGGTAPEAPPRIGTWQHDDGSITREDIWVVESTTTIKKLNNSEYREKVESLAADVCKEIDDKRQNREAESIRFGQLSPEAQKKMIHLCWMGINKLDFILQILSLNGWQTTNEKKAKEATLFAENKYATNIKRLWKEPTAKYVWSKGALNNGDILVSYADNGIALRSYSKNRLHGPKTLYFSETQATPKTFQLLKSLLCDDIDELSNLLSKKDIQTGFFKSYSTILNDLQDEIKTNKLFRDTSFNQAQLLMGRLMFIKFIEQKNWLGGDKHYLRNYFDSKQGNFYQTRLRPLFFDVLNKDRPNLSPDDLPFLNGGLFHPRENEDKLTISDTIFDRLLQLFDNYEFTLDEAPGTDDAIAVDPSMFGKVLESLIDPDIRKKSGVHYTPKHIGIPRRCFKTVLLWRYKCRNGSTG